MKHAGIYQWSLSLDVDCPYCYHFFNAADTDDFSEKLTGVKIAEAKKGIEIECPECKAQFVFDIIDGY